VDDGGGVVGSSAVWQIMVEMYLNLNMLVNFAQCDSCWVKVWESVFIKSVRGLSVMWGGDGVRGEWPFFVKAPDFSRKNAMAYMPSLVPRRSGRYSVCDAWRRIVQYSS